MKREIACVCVRAHARACGHVCVCACLHNSAPFLYTKRHGTDQTSYCRPQDCTPSTSKPLRYGIGGQEIVP